MHTTSVTTSTIFKFRSQHKVEMIEGFQGNNFVHRQEVIWLPYTTVRLYKFNDIVKTTLTHHTLHLQTVCSWKLLQWRKYYISLFLFRGRNEGQEATEALQNCCATTLRCSTISRGSIPLKKHSRRVAGGALRWEGRGWSPFHTFLWLAQTSDDSPSYPA